MKELCASNYGLCRTGRPATIAAMTKAGIKQLLKFGVSFLLLFFTLRLIDWRGSLEMIGRANLEASDSGRIKLSAPGSFLTDQIAKVLPDVGKHASDFFGQDCRITVTAREETSAPKPKPSELRSQVRQDPLVKEVITEFAAEIKDVRAKE